MNTKHITSFIDQPHQTFCFKVSCLLFILCISTVGFGQSKKNNVELYYSPTSESLNPIDLSYGYAIEYRNRYLGAKELGANYTYYISDRSAITAGISYLAFNLDAFRFYTNVSPSLEPSRVYRTDTQIKTHSIALHLSTRYKLLSTEKFGLLVSGGGFIYNIMKVKEDKMSVSGNGTSNDSDVFKAIGYNYLGYNAGLRVEYNLTENVLLTLHPTLSYSKIPLDEVDNSYYRTTANKLELTYPIGIAYTW